MPRASTTSSFISGPEQGKPAGDPRGRSPGSAIEAGPAYIGKLLSSPGLAPDMPAARELFLHLGYWPDPSQAGSDHAQLLDAQARLNDRLLGMAALADGMRVYDVGCGVGGTLATIGARHRGMRLAGINCDVRQLRVATRAVEAESGSTCSWVLGDACALPLRDDSTDRVLAIECAFHFPSRRRFLLEAARVLHRGGRLVLSDFIPSAALRAWRQGESFPGFAIESALNAWVGPWPDFWGDEADYAQLAQSCGLILTEHEDASSRTLPSYRCFLHDPSGARTNAGGDPVDRAMALVEWLQARGFLSMELFAFERAGTAF